jgi:hypothetical protein
MVQFITINNPFYRKFEYARTVIDRRAKVLEGAEKVSDGDAGDDFATS